VSADEGGHLALWFTEPWREVQEVELTGAVRALAAEGPRVAARTADGALWWFDLDTATDPELPDLLRASLSARGSPEEVTTGLTIEVTDEGFADSVGYEVVAARVQAGTRPLRVLRAAGRGVTPDGMLDLPFRPRAEVEWELDCAPAPPGPPGVPVTVALDVGSRMLPGYALTVTLQVTEPGTFEMPGASSLPS
jgi:hypothetical protein